MLRARSIVFSAFALHVATSGCGALSSVTGAWPWTVSVTTSRISFIATTASLELDVPGAEKEIAHDIDRGAASQCRYCAAGREVSAQCGCGAADLDRIGAAGAAIVL